MTQLITTAINCIIFIYSLSIILHETEMCPAFAYGFLFLSVTKVCLLGIHTNSRYPQIPLAKSGEKLIIEVPYFICTIWMAFLLALFYSCNWRLNERMVQIH